MTQEELGGAKTHNTVSGKGWFISVFDVQLLARDNFSYDTTEE